MQVMVEEWAVAELVARCLRRPADPGAWEEFVRRFHRTIRASVSAVLDQPDDDWGYYAEPRQDIIDSLAQAVYGRLVEDGGQALRSIRVNGADSMHKYLTMISINVARQYLRGKG
jgi:hypothetical protein